MAQLSGNQLPSNLHTSGHIDCRACAELADMGNRTLAVMEFGEAAAEWLSVHRRYISEETILDYQKCIKSLSAFFGGMTLKDIHIGNIRAYQVERKSRRVNKECSCLSQIMKEAGLWARIAPHYKPIPLPKSNKGRRLTWDEEDRLKRVVADADHKWGLAGNCLLVMANTSFGFKELKYLRRRDVDLEKQMISLEVRAKNDTRFRTVPLNTTAYNSMCYLIERWQRIGGSEPDQLILPHRAHVAGAGWDFTRPMGSIKNAHKKIMAAARIENFRIYDTRHHAISKWLTNPKIAPEVADAMAGHISAALRKRYCHVLMEQMRAAVDAMEPLRKSA